MDITDILQRLNHVKGAGSSQYKADCPCCGDTKQHLYIAFAPDGKILMDCKKGCSFQDIAAAMGLKATDFFPDRQKPKRELIREHIYTDTNGGILAKKQIYKTDSGKTASWQRLESGRYVQGLNGLKMPLYHADRLVKSASGTVVVVEGEKDVETMERIGYTATTSPNGATANWRNDYAEYFKGKKVVIISDNDEAGEKYARNALDCISKTAELVKLIRSADIYPEVKQKGDISDIVAMVGAEKAKTLLFDAVKSTAVYSPETAAVKAAEQHYITVKTTLQDVTVYDKIKELAPEKMPHNDRGNGELFSRIYGDKARYNATAKEWYIYKDGTWRRDVGDMVVSQYAKDLYDALILYADTLPTDADGANSYRKFAGGLGRLNVREIMLKDARAYNYITSDMLDKNQWLINCRNGTYNLKDGKFYPHTPSDLLSKMTNITYDPEADSPEFKKFLSEIMQGNAEKTRYLLTALGYSLTGDISQECFFILYGSTTRNGKSTLMEVISYMLGNENGYAVTSQPEVLAQHSNRDSRQASGDIARLKGARFLSVSEPPKDMRFDAALLKSLVGGDTITARHLREKEFQFTPSFKLFINTNHLPRVNDDTLFTSERVKVITFDRHFTPEEQDRGLKERLKSDSNISGIFNICLGGLRDYLANGLHEPQSVRDAVADYRLVSDTVGLFIAECLEPDKGCNVTVKDVYEVYHAWCLDSGYKPMSKTRLISDLRNKNLVTDTGTVNGLTKFNVIKGHKIVNGLLEDSEPPPF